MDIQEILRWQTEAVPKIIKEAGFTVSRIAVETGIPHTTLLRKLQGLSEFKPSELYRIAKVTDTNPDRLIPPLMKTVDGPKESIPS